MAHPDVYIDSLPIRCHLYGLSVSQSNHESDDEGLLDSIVMSDRPFSVQVTVEWLGNTAIALLMLRPELSVDFFAKPIAIGNAIELGTVTHFTSPKERTYRPTLEVQSPIACGLNAGLYHLGAVLRVGAEEGPALVCGAIEGVVTEIFTPHNNKKRKKR